jgi:hypothetical protein
MLKYIAFILNNTKRSLKMILKPLIKNFLIYQGTNEGLGLVKISLASVLNKTDNLTSRHIRRKRTSRPFF